MTLKECSHCNKEKDDNIHSFYFTDDSDLICENCFNNYYFSCDNCDNIFSRNDMYTYDGFHYCENCYNNAIENEEEEENNDGLVAIELPFKKIKSETFKKNRYKNFIGVELETMNRDINNNQFNEAELNKYGFSQIQDGSLDEGGAEYPSLAFNGDEALNRITAFCNALHKKKFYVNQSCGYHLHIEIPRSLAFIKKLLIFYMKYENLFYEMMPESRRHNQYCYKLKEVMNFPILDIFNFKSYEELSKKFYNCRSYKMIKNHLTKDKFYSKRYSWLNLHSIFYRKTLEIRLHSGTIDAEKIKAWAMLHLSILNYIKRHNLNEIMQLPKEHNYFLTLFNKSLQTYITNRWKKFNEINIITNNKDDLILQELKILAYIPIHEQFIISWAFRDVMSNDDYSYSDYADLIRRNQLRDFENLRRNT